MQGSCYWLAAFGFSQLVEIPTCTHKCKAFEKLQLDNHEMKQRPSPAKPVGIVQPMGLSLRCQLQSDDLFLFGIRFTVGVTSQCISTFGCVVSGMNEQQHLSGSWYQWQNWSNGFQNAAVFGTQLKSSYTAISWAHMLWFGWLRPWRLNRLETQLERSATQQELCCRTGTNCHWDTSTALVGDHRGP